MTHQGPQGAAPRDHAARWSQGTSFLLASCGVVATAAYLGADWLRTSLLGLPAGVWTIAIAQAAGYAWHRRSRRMGAAAVPLRAAAGLPQPRWNIQDLDVRLLLGRGAAAAIGGLEFIAVRLPVRIAALPDTTRLCQKLDRFSWPTLPLRVGLDVGPEAAKALASQESSTSVEWIPIPSGGDDQATLLKFRLDALVRHDLAGVLRVITAERPGQESNWFDWGIPRPLSFASIFPPLLDPSQITLDGVDFANHAEARVLSLLIRSAAQLSRAPHRLDLCDRLRGRRPSLGFSGGPRAATTLWPAEECLLELGMAVEEMASEATNSPAWKAAARVVSAWVSATDAPLEIESRKRCADACCRILPEEPEVLLRAMALRFAAWEDRSAYDALIRADRAIRARTPAEAPDQLPFLQSELEMGLPGPFTLGRVAGGIVLVCATSPFERFGHIRGDVLDDMRYSAWLVGRDQDRAVLVEVFKTLERERSAAGELPAMPLSQAA